MSIALEDGKRIIPIVVDQTDIEKTIPELTRLDRLEFCREDRFDRDLRELLEAIQGE